MSKCKNGHEVPINKRVCGECGMPNPGYAASVVSSSPRYNGKASAQVQSIPQPLHAAQSGNASVKVPENQWGEIYKELDSLADRLIAREALEADDFNKRYKVCQEKYNSGAYQAAEIDLGRYLQELKQTEARLGPLQSGNGSPSVQSPTANNNSPTRNNSSAQEEERKQKEERERNRIEAERKAEAERQRIEAEENAKAEAERLRIEGEQKVKAEAERLRLEAEQQAREEAEQKRIEAEQKAKAEAEEKARVEAERLRVEAEQKAKAEAERLRLEAEQKVRAEAEQKRLEAEQKAKAEAERQRIEAEQKAKAELESQRIEAERKAEAERQRIEAEQKARTEAEARVKAEAEQRRIEAEQKARAEAEQQRIAAEQKARTEAEARAKAEAERQRLEAEQKVRAEAEQRATAEAKVRAEAEAEQRTRAELERQRLEAEQKARAEAEQKAKQQEEAGGSTDPLVKVGQMTKEVEELLQKVGEYVPVANVNEYTQRKTNHLKPNVKVEDQLKRMSILKGEIEKEAQEGAKAKLELDRDGSICKHIVTTQLDGIGQHRKGVFQKRFQEIETNAKKQKVVELAVAMAALLADLLKAVPNAILNNPSEVQNPSTASNEPSSTPKSSSQPSTGTSSQAEESRKQEEAKQAEETKKREEARKLEEAEQKRLVEEAERKQREQAETERKQREQVETEPKRLAEEAEKKRLAEETEKKRLAEEAEKKRLAEEVEKKRLAEEVERKRLAEEAERQRLAEEAEKKRLAEEAEKNRLAEEAEKNRLAEEAEKNRLAEEAERKRLEAEQLAKAREDAFKNYTTISKDVEAALAKEGADPQRVILAQGVLQKAVDGLEKLRTEGTGNAQEINNAIAGINAPLQGVQQARALAKERAEAFKIYPPEDEKVVKEALKKNSVDAKTVTDAQGLLQKAVDGLTEVTNDEGKSGQEIEKAIKKIGEMLHSLREARRLAAEASSTPQTTPNATANQDVAAKLKPGEADALKALEQTNPKVAASVKNLLAELVNARPATTGPVLTGSQRDAKIQESTKTIKESQEKSEKAVRDQYFALKEAKETLYDKLAEMGVLGQFADEFNQRSKAALALYNDPPAGSKAADASKELLMLWEIMKAKSADGAKVADEIDGWKKFSAQKQIQTESERSKAEAEQSIIELKRAETEAALLKAVQFGPLSKTQTTKGADAQVAILKHFKDNPVLALDALDIAERAANPDVVARGLPVVAKAAADSFGGWDAATARKMAQNALKLGDQCGGKLGDADYFSRMEAYYAVTPPTENPLYEAGVIKDVVDGKQTSTISTAKLGVSYAGALGGAIIKNGKVDFDTDDAKKVVDALHFHPRSLQTPLPNLAVHVEAFRKDFKSKESEYTAVLDDVKKPKNDAAGQIVRKSLAPGNGKTGALTDDDAKAAVMSAMLTPFAQGQVGSCFATCNCLDYREKEPVKLMKQFKGMVNDGVLKMENDPDGLPVITNLPADENGLLGSWQYGVTTLGAQAANSEQRKELENSLTQNLSGADPQLTALKERRKSEYEEQQRLYVRATQAHVTLTTATGAAAILQAETDYDAALLANNNKIAELSVTDSQITALKDKWTQRTNLLKNALPNAFTFGYDPTTPRKGGDGSSTAGAWVMQQRGAGPDGADKPLTRQMDFEAALEKCIDDSIPDINEANATKAIVGTAAFTAAMKKSYTTPNDPGTPWEMAGGGHESDSKKVLFGGAPTGKPVFTPPAKGQPGGSEGERATALLTNLVDTFKTRPDPTVTMGVKGIHSMRFMPLDPSLESLKVGGNVAANVQTLLVDAGNTKKDEPVSQGKAEYLCGKAVDNFMADLLKSDERVAAARVNFPVSEPNVSMTPAKLKEHLLKNFQVEVDAATAEAKKEVDTEAARRQLEASQDAASAEATVKAEAERREKEAKQKITAARMKARTLGTPQEKEALITQATNANPPMTQDEKDLMRAGLITKKAMTQDEKDAMLDTVTKEKTKEKLTPISNAIDTFLLKEFNFPEFKISNTNWGSAKDRTFHVIAPDPATGVPALWKKQEPGDTYQRESDDWLEKGWDYVD